jgi:hypothetical protein
VLEAYRQAKGKPQARQPPGVWTAWSTTHRWQGRAAAYDAYLEREARKKAEKEHIAALAQMHKDHLQAGQLLRSRGVEFFAHNKVSKAGDATAALGKGIEIERQARGLPTYILEIASASPEQLDILLADIERGLAASEGTGAAAAAGTRSDVATRNGHSRKPATVVSGAGVEDP